jgi:hypothetical protein
VAISEKEQKHGSVCAVREKHNFCTGKKMLALLAVVYAISCEVTLSNGYYNLSGLALGAGYISR